MSNLTSLSTFLLLGFSEARESQLLHFFVFLAIYLMAMTGNILIVIAIVLDQKLHTPMYFFLINLAMLDVGSVSVMVPKSMAISLTNNRSISYFGCVAQVFFNLFFLTSDFTLLTVMAHDRYVAICNPLQYERIMHKGACLQMVAIVWTTGLLYAIVHTSSTFANTFCSNTVNQFFCELPKLLKLSCSDFYLVEAGLIVVGGSLGLGCLIYIVITYMQIFAIVLRIPSVHGKKKALSTCLPHLTVVSLLMFSAIVAYASSSTNYSSGLDIAFAVIYTIIPPTLNPFIYSMRNKDIKIALWKLLDVGPSSKTIFRLL
ncbi:olfactory receptor 14A16-like [Rhineura floridana]|uniref:olfactory receptor 14A16-like n=1 Tax=Rhineura floridana TaxID=261503 RepID=UPI002AC8155C|nr:olfactory receptor 14A16-like [Rhineura floridana]